MHRMLYFVLSAVFAFVPLLAASSAPAQNAKIEIVPSVGGYTINPVVITRDGRFAAIATGNGAELWDLEKGRLVRKFAGVKSLTNSVDISPDGTRIAASGENMIVIWEVSTGRITASFNVELEHVRG